MITFWKRFLPHNTTKLPRSHNTTHLTTSLTSPSASMFLHESNSSSTIYKCDNWKPTKPHVLGQQWMIMAFLINPLSPIPTLESAPIQLYQRICRQIYLNSTALNFRVCSVHNLSRMPKCWARLCPIQFANSTP
jgi:hypothetical protein